MTTALLFLGAQVAIVAFGLPAAFHPSLRRAPGAARAGAAFGTGAVALTVEATLFSTLGVRWSLPSLALPLLVVSIALSVFWARRPSLFWTRPAPAAAATGVATAAMGLGLGHLVLSLASARATSSDFVLFWGVKAARFAAARGIDAELLGSQFSHHLVPDYPPLVPVWLAWSALVAGELPWQLAPAGAAIWIVATVPAVLVFLRQRLSAAAAISVAAFWTVALALSTVHSRSGGNAEAPLLFFETVALAALLAEPPAGSRPSRFLAAVALAGAVLCKVEGAVGVLLIVAGVVARDHLERRPDRLRRLVPLIVAPLLALALWLTFQASHGLRVGYRTHGGLSSVHFEFLSSVLRNMAAHLQSGTAWLAWLIPLGVLVIRGVWKRHDLSPALFLSAGLLLFFLFDYLHDTTDPAVRIGWTLDRISQPALSALILAAGLATGTNDPRALRKRGSRGSPTEEPDIVGTTT